MNFAFPEFPEQRTLPHSEEAERAVLGAMLLDGACIDEIEGQIFGDDFYHERHKLVFDAILAVRDEGVDIRTVQAHLEAHEQFEQIGGLAYLTGLDLDLPDIGRIGTYAAIVKERSLRRRFIMIQAEAIRDAFNGDKQLESLAGEGITRLDALLDRRRNGLGFRPLSEWIDLYEASVLDRDHSQQTGFTTGIADLDRILVKAEYGHLWYIGARPGVGKTAMLCQWCDHEALRNRQATGIVSLEMMGEEIVHRMTVRRTLIDSDTIRSGHITQSDRTRIVKDFSSIYQAPLYIDDTPGQNVFEICAAVRNLNRKHGTRLIFVDFLTLISRTGLPKDETGYRAVKAISEELRNLAKELRACVVVCVQLNKQAGREHRPPELTDIKEAGEEAADGVIFLHRLPDEDNRSLLGGKGLITVAKHRGGRTGSFEAYYAGDRLAWRAMTEDAAYQNAG